MEQSSCSVSELVGGDEPELIHGGGVLELVHGGGVPEPVRGGELVLETELLEALHLLVGVAGTGLLLVDVARACPSRGVLLPSSWSRCWRRSLRTSPFSARASKVRRSRDGCPTTGTGAG